jgi:triosephosphate isomerase
MYRKPIALTNWKMEMTIAESPAFLRDFQALDGDLLSQIQVVLCPPYTGLFAMALALDTKSSIQLGGQTVFAAGGGAHTGQIFARLVADAGGRWCRAARARSPRLCRDHASQRSRTSPAGTRQLTAIA